MTLENTVDKVTLVKASIGPFVATASVFLALKVLSFKLDFALVPSFRPKTVLLVVHPFALVGGSFGVNECSSTIRHPVEPLSLVDRSVSLDHSAKALHHVHAKLTLVLRPVLPDQDAEAVLHFTSIHEPPEIHA